MGDAKRVGTPAWEQLRAEAVARAGGRCELCNRPNSMLCLKVVNRAHGPVLTLEDVQAACAGCLHGEPPKKQRGRRRMVFEKRRRP